MIFVRRLRVFWSLTRDDRARIIEALVLPIFILVGFRLIGVPRTQGLMRRWALRGKALANTVSACPGRQELEIRNACRAQRIVKRATGIPGNCLVNSLTLWTLLLRRGISTDLRIGFRKREGQIEGHAWIELDEAPVNESLSKTLTFAPYETPVSFDLWQRSSRNPVSRFLNRTASR